MSFTIMKRFVLATVAVGLTLGGVAHQMPTGQGQEKKAGSEAGKEERVFRAGAATSNITPRLGRNIVGGFSPAPATHIHDDLHVRCLVLDDGQTKIAFAVCDSLGIDREVYDHARRLIAKETGIPGDNVLMSATHTHSGPSWHGRDDNDGDYPNFLARRIADGVIRAHHNLEPARIGWGVGKEPNQVFNRRWKVKPGPLQANPFGGMDPVRMNPGYSPDLIEPAGPTDPEISFLTVQSRAGRPIALLANYSLHYVGGTRPGEMSADYFAVFANRIQQLLGADRLDPPFVGILSNGTSGDVNNNNYASRSTERLQPYERMRRVAYAVAAEVDRVHQTVRFHDWVPLGARLREISLATRKPTPEQVTWARQTLDKPPTAPPYHPRERNYAQRVLALQDAPERSEIVLQTFRVGDVGIATIPFEVFAETGLEIKEKSPFKPSFTVSLANGSGGYLPTPPQHKVGGYETWLGTNRVEIDASVKIVDALLESFNRLEK